MYMTLIANGALPVETAVIVRKSDLDPYKHVSSSQYLELLDCAVWDWYQGQKGKEYPAERAGLSRVEIDYRRSIDRTGPVGVKLSRTADQAGLVGFEINDPNNKKVFASGRLVMGPPIAREKVAESGLPGHPIVYDRTIDVGYNDLNPSNEVDYTKYLAYVITSRWHFLKEKFGVENEYFIGRGLAFFMSRAEINLGNPLSGAKNVRVRSWIARLESNQTEITVPFEIVGKDGNIVYAHGKLQFVIMDLSGEKPKRVSLPEWVNEIFWEKR